MVITLLCFETISEGDLGLITMLTPKMKQLVASAALIFHLTPTQGFLVNSYVSAPIRSNPWVSRRQTPSTFRLMASETSNIVAFLDGVHHSGFQFRIVVSKLSEKFLIHLFN